MKLNYKKSQYLFSTAVLSAVIIIIVLINYISFHHFFRIDLTEDDRYAISQVSKETLRNLDDVVTVKAYVSSDVPAHFSPYVKEIKDLLLEFKAHGKSNIDLIYLDPIKDEKIMQEVQNLGIYEIPLEVKDDSTGKIEQQIIFLSLAISHAGQTEVINMLNQSTLEYEILLALKRLTAEDKKKIAFIQGHGEHTINGSDQAGSTQNGAYYHFAKVLREFYDISTLELSNIEEIEEIDTLIIGGPKSEFTDLDLYKIDQFLMKGGNVVFLLDKLSIEGNLEVIENKSNIDQLIASYGFKLEKNVIADEYPFNSVVPLNQGLFTQYVNYPAWPKLYKTNFNQDIPILKNIDSIFFPWPGSISVEEKENINVDILATTSENSWEIIDDFQLHPQMLKKPEERAQFNLVALSQGKFTSYFKDKNLPNILVDNEDELISTIASPLEESFIEEARDDSSSILLISDSDFLAFTGEKQNTVFMQNAIDYLTIDSDLIKLRSRGMTDRPLLNANETEKTVLKVLGIYLIPFLIIAFGVIRSLRRRKHKFLSINK